MGVIYQHHRKGVIYQHHRKGVIYQHHRKGVIYQHHRKGVIYQHHRKGVMYQLCRNFNITLQSYFILCFAAMESSVSMHGLHKFHPQYYRHIYLVH